MAGLESIIEIFFFFHLRISIRFPSLFYEIFHGFKHLNPICYISIGSLVLEDLYLLALDGFEKSEADSNLYYIVVGEIHLFLCYMFMIFSL